ncbi:ubiquinone/menaquinone biosynthesis C-methylase UbiE [Kitasatospora sp. MAA4]|uniref:class I SAM-dependent methyltransferase n=1 Tax=Kitasatospora sp. MAA4 TaxID=3035093 RepID=UPI0024754831|nr:class I SAM-dependent methyltransferase [Kitasatospora sp. MAA4]MDH6133614.1 ubiquinone/menaquinone biosynthesis C-methylase UbiE [Kitasatospora sp. MAA4]
MSENPVRQFYDQLTADYHLIYQDWDAGIARQGAALDQLITAQLGATAQTVLDCACGIGTQAIGLAQRGHRVTGSDLSPAAAARAVREAGTRGVALPTTAADMRQLPFRATSFDAVLCADNALPHLLTAEDVHAALTDMHRVLRADGLLLLSIRPYEQARLTHPTTTPLQVSHTPAGRTITFQLWNWHADGQRYDVEHVQLLPEGDAWTSRVRRTTYWALTREQLTGFVIDAGFTEPTWHRPEDSGFFQPLLTARSR